MVSISCLCGESHFEVEFGTLSSVGFDNAFTISVTFLLYGGTTTGYCSTCVVGLVIYSKGPDTIFLSSFNLPIFIFGIQLSFSNLKILIISTCLVGCRIDLPSI